MKRSEFRRLYTLYNTIFIKLKEKHNILYKNMYEYILACLHVCTQGLYMYTCICTHTQGNENMEVRLGIRSAEYLQEP